MCEQSPYFSFHWLSVVLTFFSKQALSKSTSVEQYVTLLLGMVIFLIFIWKHQQICGLHKNFERTIDERELDFTTLTSIFTSIKHTTFDFRIKTSSISGQLHGNQFTSGRMDENYPFCLFAGCSSHLCNSKSHFQLLPVLCQGFGTRCFWTAISVLVRPHQFKGVLFTLSKFQATDWKNPAGYLVACVEQYIVMAYFSHFCAAALSLKIGCYFMDMEFIRDIKNDISSISQTAKSRKNHPDMLRQMPGSIKFHSHVKQLSSIE